MKIKNFRVINFPITSYTVLHSDENLDKKV